MEIDGQAVSAEETSSLALYNYGHFTSMLVKDRRVRGLTLHLDRLVHDCQVLFGTQLYPARVRQLVRQAVGATNEPLAVRVTVFAPHLELGHPGTAVQPSILVTTRPAASLDLPPLRVTAASYQRDLPTVKHVGLFATMYHRRIAQLHGHDDVLFVDAQSRISEGATWNIGFFDGDRVVWPHGECLLGVTMRLLANVFALTGRASVSKTVRLSDLPSMQSAFVTNASVGVRPVRSIGEVRFAENSGIIEQLQKDYLAIPGEPI
jgi:branched-subunit amino acid aminotransferase/4-amino-4-deoxychorismate lyase